MSPWLSDLFLGSQSDERLVTLARAGQERAFVAIVQRYQRQLLAFARRLDSRGRAEDIVQQSLLSAFAALQAGTEVKHLRGWLHQIVRNAAAKSANGISVLELHDPLDGPMPATTPLEEQVERRLMAIDALGLLSELPARQRDALVQTALNGRSRVEVADAMGVSEGAVRQLLHRARAAMRTAVTAIVPYPLAQWLTSPRGAQTAELALGGGAAAGGAALKLGAVVVSGVVAAGIVVSGPAGHAHHVKAGRHHATAATRIALASATRAGEGQGARSGSSFGVSAGSKSGADRGSRDHVATHPVRPHSDGGSGPGRGDGSDGSGPSGAASSGSDHGGSSSDGSNSGDGGHGGTASSGDSHGSTGVSLSSGSGDGGGGSGGGLSGGSAGGVDGGSSGGSDGGSASSPSTTSASPTTPLQSGGSGRD